MIDDRTRPGGHLRFPGEVRGGVRADRRTRRGSARIPFAHARRRHLPCPPSGESRAPWPQRSWTSMRASARPTLREVCRFRVTRTSSAQWTCSTLPAGGVDYTILATRARPVRVREVTIPVADLEDIIRSKERQIVRRISGPCPSCANCSPRYASAVAHEGRPNSSERVTCAATYAAGSGSPRIRLRPTRGSARRHLTTRRRRRTSERRDPA